MRKIRSFPAYIILVLLFFPPGGAPLLAQDNSIEIDNSSLIPELVLNHFKLFEKRDILEITLMFDISTYLREKPDEEYLDALLTYKYNETDSINKKIRIRARGNFRYRTCDFPPLRLNFKDASFGFSDLDSLTNVKMVTHCFDNEAYQNYLMREYLIYKLYNVVTEYSFRVRFLKIRYIDTGKKGLDFEQYGFIIEPLDRLLFRSHAIEIEDTAVGFDDIEYEMMTRIAVFQYLIGNSDWYIPMIHNVKILKELDKYSSSVMAIPYDFDYSGFVNAHYAVPRKDLNLVSIKDRAYLGPCRSEEEFRRTLEEFLTLKEDFLDEVRNFEYLNRTVKRELIDYINSFYDLYRKDDILKRLMRECEE